MDAEEIARAIGDLENRVERLRALYDQYFMGIERIEPLTPRKDVERRLWALRREQIRNTGLRFKLETTIQRYNTYQQYWQRIVREIEAGTYQRDLGRAAQRFGDNVVTAFAKRRQKMYEKGLEKKAERDARRTGPGASQAPPPEETEAEIEEIEDAPPSSNEVDVTFEDSDAAAPVAARGARVAPQREAPYVPPPPSHEPLELEISEPAPPPPPRPAAARPGVAGPAPNAEQRRGPPAPAAPPAPGARPAPARQPTAPPSPTAAIHQRPAAAGPPPYASRPVVEPSAPTPGSPAKPAVPAPGSPAKPVVPAAAPKPAAPMAAPLKPTAPITPIGKPAMPIASPAKPATPVATPAKPAPSAPQTAPSAFAPKPAVPAAPNPAVPAARPPAASRPDIPPARPPAASRPDVPAPAVLSEDNGLSPIRMRQIYGQFVEAKRRANESTAAVTYEKIASNLENVAKELRAKHKARSVDFEVVMKNGKPVLKPVVKG